MNKTVLASIIIVASILGLIGSYYLYTYNNSELNFQSDSSQKSLIYYLKTSSFDFYVNKDNDFTIKSNENNKQMVIKNNSLIKTFIAGWEKININDEVYLVKPKASLKCEQIKVQLMYPFSGNDITSVLEEVSCVNGSPELSFI